MTETSRSRYPDRRPERARCLDFAMDSWTGDRPRAVQEQYYHQGQGMQWLGWLSTCTGLWLAGEVRFLEVLAIETADVVLMSDDLHKIPFAIGLARHAEKVVWQNLIFAMAVIVILVASAFGARLLLPLGVLGHEGSTVLVVLNGLRLLGYKGT